MPHHHPPSEGEEENKEMNTNMQREIKFRAWDKEAKEVLDWADFQSELEMREVFLPDQNDIVVMQFTGLHDKNGNEIYEGDVLENVDGRRYEVRWFNGAFWWFHPPYTKMDKYAASAEGGNPKANEIGSEISKFGYGSVLKVIGNIYENPDLLQGAPPSEAKTKSDLTLTKKMENKA